MMTLSEKLAKAFQAGFQKEAGWDDMVRSVGKHVGGLFETSKPGVFKDDIYSADSLMNAAKRHEQGGFGNAKETMSNIAPFVRENQRRLGYETLGGAGVTGLGLAETTGMTDFV